MFSMYVGGNRRWVPLENVSKREAILAPVSKQWIAKDIPSYGSQSKRAKMAIHWFGKYQYYFL